MHTCTALHDPIDRSSADKIEGITDIVIYVCINMLHVWYIAIIYIIIYNYIVEPV